MLPMTPPVTPQTVQLPASPKLQILTRFRSRVIGNERTIRVYLPPGYDGRKRQRYPVLYMNDGQNLFDPKTAFGGVAWQLGETADQLVAAGLIEPLIIVGIDNAGEKRLGEYTPTRHEAHRGSGRANRYGRMLVEELKPLIDSRYRTMPDRENTGIGGSSLGGLVALFVALRHSDRFAKAAVLSPSVWWHDRVILGEVDRLQSKPEVKLWLDMGTRESSEGIADARALVEELIRKGWVPGKDLAYTEVEGAGHHESAWAARSRDVLLSLFPKS